MSIGKERVDKGGEGICPVTVVRATRETGNTSIGIVVGGRQDMRPSYLTC